MKPIHTLVFWLVTGSVVWADQAETTDRPFVAVWRQYDGSRAASEAPYLRFAIWPDGRVLFSADPSKWDHELRRGKISDARVARLQAALSDTGIFKLKRTTYLVPSAPKDCLMVDLDGKQQLLHWDERKLPGYGININPTPQDLEFMRCWKAVNHLGVVALPDEGEVVKERVQIPESWHPTQPNAASAHTKAMDHSDFVFVCEVVEEGPLSHGNNSVQKSYLVRYPETLHHGLVGIDLPGEIWIHYDSTRYPDVPKSGFESTFHKGDSFIAFLDYVDEGESLFQIVRVEESDRKEQIKKAIRDYRSRKHRPKDAPGPDDGEFAKAVALANSKLRATVAPASDYKLIKTEMTWAKGKYVWLVTYRPLKLLSEDPSKERMGVGGEVFIRVELKTGQTEVRYGE